MMSRSRRLFVLLLHLIGCQHYYLHPSLLTLNPTAGIVGVQPWPIVLEKVLDPSTLFSTSYKKHRRRRRHGQRRRVPHSSLYENENINGDDEENEEAFWLQDEVTGTCLGPTARLTLCGDATLWWVAKRKNNHIKKRRLKMGIWGADEEKATTTASTNVAGGNKETALAFYVVDRNVPIGTVRAAEVTSSSSRSNEGNSRSNNDIKLLSWWERALLGARGLGYQEQQEELPVPMDCLVVTNHQNDDEKKSSSSQVAVQKCTEASQWAWTMNEEWGLHPVLDEEATAAALSSFSSLSSSSTLPLGNVCLVREEISSSVPKLAPCHENEDASGPAEGLVRLSLVRYRAITLPEAAARTTSSSSASNSATEAAAMMRNKSTTVASSSFTTRQQRGPAASSSSTRGNGMKNYHVAAAATPVEAMTASASQTLGRSTSPAPFQQQLEEQKQPSGSSTRRDVKPLPSNKDLAHKYATSVSTMHPELHLSSRLNFHHHSSPQKTSTTTTPEVKAKRAQDSSPSPSPQHQSQEWPASSKMNKMKSPFLQRALDDTNPILLTGKDRFKQKSLRALAHPEAGSEQDSSSNRIRSRRASIPIHPYIAAANNEIWTDPQTSLTYPTDLSGYLGRDPKTHGRHTLMGVGQFRKGYVIKVYGVAIYVSKRDVLSDPFFKPFAHMTASELRQEPDFYRHLRVDAHNFERTIVIKTNMQLPAEVMRNSLQYDWKMLTEEAKSTLINSSMQPRPADDEILKFIQSPENPGRCSCSQVAPEEYQADPECCARGTELVFTWLKTGDLEIRLSGRLVDTFSRPDIAEGIFFEYLRTDDPMSPELIDNVVKGFPFLLAPLDQVKGVKIGQSHQQSPSSKPGERENPLVHAATEMADAVISNAMGMAGAVQHAATDAVEHASNAARFMGDSARNMSHEANRVREALMKQASSMPDMFMKILSREQDPIATVTEWVESNFTPTQDEVYFPERRLSSGRVFGYPLSRWFDEVYYAPDEIGPMIVTPTINGTRKMFLYLVHLYLLLLFIVSFPGSYITRTKPIRKRSHLSRQSSDESTVKRAHTTFKNTTPAVTVLKDKTTLAFPDIARSSQDRLHCQERTYSRGCLPPTSKFPFKDNNLRNDSSERLKKKSLSYFL